MAKPMEKRWLGAIKLNENRVYEFVNPAAENTLDVATTTLERNDDCNLQLKYKKQNRRSKLQNR